MPGPRLVPASNQRVSFKNENRQDDAESASSYGGGPVYEYDEIEDDTDDAPVQPSRKRKARTVQPGNNSAPDHRFLFDQDFSDFHKAFRQSFSFTRAPSPPAVPQPGNDTTMATGSPSQQSAPNGRLSVSTSEQDNSSVVPAKRKGVAIVKPSKRARPEGENSSLPSSKRASVDGKAISPRPKGSGIYKTGTWAYAPDDDVGSEKITKVVNEISATIEASADKPAKVTRNSYSRMKSTLQGTSAVTTPSQEPPSAGDRRFSTALRSSLASESSIRRSSRARNVPDYSSFQAAEIDDDEPDAAVNGSPIVAKGRKPSTLGSSVSHESTPLRDQRTRSTSASTAVQPAPTPEPAVKPKKTWTAIVYETLANVRNQSLTLVEIGEAIKVQYPYYALPAHADTLKSSPRNPLYSHPAFRKVQRADGKLAWGLYPGDFYDKKTNKLLTAGAPPAAVMPSVERPEPMVEDVVEDFVEDDDYQDDAAGQLQDTTSDYPEARVKTDQKVHSSSSRVQNSGEVIVSTPKEQLKGIEVGEEQPRPSEIIRPSPALVPSSARSSNAGVEVVTDSVASQPPTHAFLQSRDQRRLAGIVHKDLVDSFTDEEMDRFLRETKLHYFKNMELNLQNIDQILKTVMPSGLKSSEDDVFVCAEDLRKDYEGRTWESEWFLKFVSDEVTRFDTNMDGFMKHVDRPEKIRLDFWTGPSKWKPTSFTQVFSAFADTVDLDKVWATKHWHDFAKKIFCTACDATWEYRFEPRSTVNPGKIYESIRAALNERYPDRSSKIWDVPVVYQMPAVVPDSRKASFASNASLPRQSSVEKGEGLRRQFPHELEVQETQRTDATTNGDAA